MKQITFEELLEIFKEHLSQEEVFIRLNSNTGPIINRVFVKYELDGSDQPHSIELEYNENTKVTKVFLYRGIKYINIELNKVIICSLNSICREIAHLYFNKEKTEEIELDQLF